MRFFQPANRIVALLLAILFASSAVASEEIIDLSDPYQILLRHYEAVGGLERLNNSITSTSEGRVHYDGLQGTFKHWGKRPLQYRTEEDYAIITQITGDTGEFAWFFDTNGQQLIQKDEDTLKRRRISTLIDQYEHLNRQSPYFSLTFAGIKIVKGRPCYEVILDNTINTDRGHFFYDAQTMFMTASLHRQPDMEIESYYDDYKIVDGLVVSYHQHNTYHPWNKTEETWTAHFANNPPVDDKLFSPPQREKGYHFKDGADKAAIPFQLIENLIYLPVTVGGDTRYWVLDSGASMSIIDKDYAEQHGLKVEGSIRGYGFGELFDLYFVGVPDHQVGSILFDSQKMYAAKDLSARSYEPVMAGILGYDFLSRFVVEVDYDQQLVTFHDPDTFAYQGSGVTLDAPLKYRTFTLPTVVDGKFESLWSVDLGSYHSSIHYPFAEKHGLEKRAGVEIVSQGMAGVSLEKNIQFNCLQIDRFRLDHPLLSIPAEKGVGATALGEVGGNLGNSTLRHFRLFLNYPQQKVTLEEGKAFNKAFPQDKSGMIIGRAENNQAMISYLANICPATKAGLVVGDLILELAGETIGPDHLIVHLRELMRGPAGTVIPIKVQRGEEIISTTLTLEDLYPPNTSGCTR